MEVLKLKVLLCFLDMREEDLNVTNLAVTLGEEKYAISRVFTAMEKEGLLDRSNKRKPVLTSMGHALAGKYSHKVNGLMGHLLYAGVTHEDARADAIAMAVYCRDTTFAKMRQQGMARQVKLGFHEGMEFDGDRLCRRYKEKTMPLTFLIYKDEALGEDKLSKWNDYFENPSVLEIRNMQGEVLLHAFHLPQECHFSYWDQETWRSMPRQGNVLSFPAAVMKFQSLGKDEGRMLYGRIWLRVQKGETEERILFTTYIA